MTQKTSPFVEGKYGWEFGESGWNTGMDENLVKFSFLFDNNIDGIVSNLPAPVNGKAYYLSTDKRVYYAASNVFYSSPLPLWYVLKNRSDGSQLVFNGTTLVPVPSTISLNSSITDLTETVADNLNTSLAYTDEKTSALVSLSDLSDSVDLNKGVFLVGGASRQVDNLIKLREIIGRYNNDQVNVLGHTVVGLGGGPFYWDEASTQADDNATVIKPTEVSTGRWKRTFSSINPYIFGAYGDGIIDDSVALQAAINYAQVNTGELEIPSGKFLYSITLLQTRALTVKGFGRRASRLIYSGSGQAWLAQPPYASEGSNTDWVWKDFSLVPSVAGGGTFGLHIKLSPAGPQVCYLADSLVQGLFIGNFGNRGLYLDNSVANVDGFFTSQFKQNVIVNGILGSKVGDSLTFAYNKIYGNNCGIEMNGVAGAREMVIQENNITTSGGTIALLDVEGATIKDNQLEHPGYLSGYTGIYDCGVYLHNCYMPLIISNTINPDNGAATAPSNPGIATSCIAMDGTTTLAVFRGNDIQKGALFHINIGEPSVSDTYLDETNRYYGATPSISDLGTRTIKPTLRGNIVYDPPSLNNGDTATVSVPLVGVRPGQFPSASLTTIQPGIDITCIVYTDSVSVQFYNRSGAAVDMASGMLNVKVSS